MLAPLPWRWLAVATCAALLLNITCFTGLIGSDDVLYTSFAEAIARADFLPKAHHYGVRWGVIAPVGVLYAAFGVREWTTVVLPLLTAAASAPLVMLIGARLFDRRTALVAGALLATFPLHLRYASILVPEPILGFFVLLAVLLFLSARHVPEDRGWPAYGIYSGIVLGVAYLSKEPAAFVALALLTEAGVRRDWKLGASLLAGIAVVVLVEHAFYLLTTGDILFRFSALGVHHQSAGVLAANDELGYRLTKTYPRMMLVPNVDFGLHSTFSIAIAGGAVLAWRSSRCRLLMLWALLPWLYLNFGTSSFEEYTALPAAPRYIAIAYPPLFILAGAGITRVWKRRPAAGRAFAAVIAVVCFVGVACALATRNTGYRTADIDVLRGIARQIEELELRRVHVDFQTTIWFQTLRILTNGEIEAVSPSDAQLIIQPDPFGLPKASLTGIE